MHCALLHKDESIAAALLRARARINTVAKDGTTPLHAAVIQVLLDKISTEHLLEFTHNSNATYSDGCRYCKEGIFDHLRVSDIYLFIVG